MKAKLVDGTVTQRVGEILQIKIFIQHMYLMKIATSYVV